MENDLTLIIPYRQRQQAFNSFYGWFLSCQNKKLPLPKVIFIESDKTPSLEIQKKAEQIGFKYFFVENKKVFHKTSILNIGLNEVSTIFVTPYDIDLIPYQNTLSHHLQLAKTSPCLLVTGYRLMISQSFLKPDDNLESIIKQSAIAPEDQPGPLKKYLTSYEKFGVLPLFLTEKLKNIGGWDENFVGWGGEDQDIIHRYCNQDYTLCRVPDLVYLHLEHHHNSNWYSPEIINKNREYYHRKYNKNDSQS